MKIKSIVLTAALATAFSAFSASVDVDWFTTNVTSVVKYFDRNINDPVVVTNSVAAPAGFTVAAYAVTAYVTNLVVFAEKPSVPGEFNTLSAKGAICAAYENSTAKWFGLSNDVGWVQLDTKTAPNDGSAYKLRSEFGASTVTYKVSTIADNSEVASSAAWDRVGGAPFVPNLYAFAGMGGCTNIVGEIVVTAANTAAVTVPDGKILISDAAAYADVRDNPTDLDSNRLEKWVNYVLGIDGTNAEAKPYAAPVQNASDAELTFSLGGVNVGEHVTGAKVSYTVETLTSVSPATVDGSVTEPTPVDVGTQISVGVPKAVRYYRIKIKIDPAH